MITAKLQNRKAIVTIVVLVATWHFDPDLGEWLEYCPLPGRIAKETISDANGKAPVGLP